MNQTLKAALLLFSLVLINIGLWVLAIIILVPWPLLLSQCALAWIFGLRHAIDADHIAAIDNVTRRLVEDQRAKNSGTGEDSPAGSFTEQLPLAVGLYFSLGHSTLVIIVCIIVVAIARSLEEDLARFGEIAGIVGTSFSIIVLFSMAIINLMIFRSLLVAKEEYTGVEDEEQARLLESQSESSHDNEAVNQDNQRSAGQLQSRGFVSKLLNPLLKSINAEWKMLLIGLLFSVGFDSSAEISLLVISALTLSNPPPSDQLPDGRATPLLPTYFTMMIPLLFTGGMCLVDTLDGILMARMYAWAYQSANGSGRKLFFNLAVTLTSILFGLSVAILQSMCLVADQLKLAGPFWEFWLRASENYEIIGGSMVLLFAAAWAAAWMIYRQLK